MKGRNLIFYALTTLLNSFLYFGVIFTYGILALPHVLIFWLSFKRLTKISNFKTNHSPTLFSAIPCLTQNIVLLVVFFNEADLIGFYFSWIGAVLIIVSCVEFFIVRNMFIKPKIIIK